MLKFITSTFIINSVVFIIFFELFFYKDISFQSCNSLYCIYMNFKHIYIYYMIVYFFMATACILLVYFLGLHKQNSKKISMWILFLVILFLVGFILYAANKYYRCIWINYSFSTWIVMVFSNYIYEVPLIYIKQILLFIILTITIVWRFIKNENK